MPSVRSTLLALMAVAASVGTLEAQGRRAPPPRGHIGFNAVVAEPQGEFGDFVGTGYGLSLNGHFNPDRRSGLGLRLEAGFVRYGHFRDPACFSATVGCRVLLDVVTSNDIFFGSIGPELIVPAGPVRPYVNAGIGFAYFNTSSRVQGYDYDSFGHTTHFDDITLAWSTGAGVLVQLSRGRTPLALDLGARYHGNGVADYLTERDIVDELDGSVTVYPRRGRTDLVTFQAGVSVGIGRDRGRRRR